MNFADLYNNNREAVRKAMTSLWCGEANNESQQSYIKQMKALIGDLFAPSTAMPVVQCMNPYESVHSVAPEEAKALIGSLWTSRYSPYEHQYQCWKTLLEEKSDAGKPMSIVITTGTGSGKTECFMMPLVHDLTQQQAKSQIQALFLYPLNALMEDQKERLEELLKDTELTYTVYNGDLPESEPNADDNSPQAVRSRRTIEQLRGAIKDEKGNIVDYKYKRMLYTRKMVRETPPNILLTNPTMLEYILLRGNDASLINPIQQSLRWVAIDETHTYTGAGAAELAMLLRRVLLAFNVDASDVRFATSSATFGNADTPEKALEEQGKLQQFIADIAGIQAAQVRVIGGKRVGEELIPVNGDEERWHAIFKAEYIPLDKLFNGEESISEKLQLLDEMCQRVEGSNTMKLKVHYFYRVPNNGLYVRLTEHADGSFKIHTENSIDEKNRDVNPLLELSRCKQCGEYVAVAQVNTQDGAYEAPDSDDSDMFDFPEESEDDSEKKFAILGLSNSANLKGDNNVKLEVVGGKLEPLLFDKKGVGNWHIVGNMRQCCPYCNSKLVKKKETELEEDADTAVPERMSLHKFRLSADFISRMIAPSVLDQLEKGTSKDPNKIVFHDGQQYISFVDSRQAAAIATMKQNLEQERLWFYTTIYNELCKRKADEYNTQNEINELRGLLRSDSLSDQEFDEISFKIRRLRAKCKGYMSWMEIANLLFEDRYCAKFCSLFIKRSGESEELDKDGAIKEMVLRQYVQSLMVMYLANKVSSVATQETMGLFHPCYPLLEKVQLPEVVRQFNSLLKNEANCISDNDWRNLLQIFIDYTVRSNQSFFLQIPDYEQIDIFSSVRFATEKSRRRPAKKPKMDEDRVSSARIVRYLCGLIVRDDASLSLNDAYKKYFTQIKEVVDALWSDLTERKKGESGCLLEHGTSWDEDTRKQVNDKMLDGVIPYRLNLVNMSFKLFEDVYLCDVNASTGERHAVCLRPIENNFKHFSPYLQGTTPIDLKEELHEKWTLFPYFQASGLAVDTEKLDAWAQQNRSLLWNNRIWGKEGDFSDYLENIHLGPKLFIQAEHTAQVDKTISRELQSEFKDHTVNILACSTTMEMGVDLGNLEVVMLSSVPPMPANYKQRAGRSGRNNKVRSACITLCGSDAIGLRTLYKPIEKIISREVAIPFVDLMSPQVIQRHVNSYLIRVFGVFAGGQRGGSLNQKVVDYYTPFEIRNNAGRLEVIDRDNRDVDPGNRMGDPDGTPYECFNRKCAEPLTDELKNSLERLLKNTVFDNQLGYVVNRARQENERCYSELYLKLEDYGYAFCGNGEIKPKFRTKLKMQYLEVLNNRLLNFWATNRFTPNANMPVNVLSLDLNSNGKRKYFSASSSSNPSYSLREAIAQYAPGNSVVVDGVVYMVRGVEFTNQYRGVNSFKQIFRNSDKTVIDDSNVLSNKQPWTVSGKEGLELVQPVGFVPDMNEEITRIMDNNAFTRVSAQLIDTDDWIDRVTEPHLYSVRSNRDSGNAKILYYNEGVGFGYCMCTRCGRMVLESEAAAKSINPLKLPDEMNPIRPKKKAGQNMDGTQTADGNDSNAQKPEKPNFHFAISGKDVLKACSGSNNKECIKRNVIVGDLIQTDYSEIRVRHMGQKHWISNRDAEHNLLFTVGIVFTQSLVDILGKERGAVDFAITPNGHICIFDTNPGGAGYSNQLASMQLMKEVVNASFVLLQQAKEMNSKDMLLDKFTLRYLKYIDIDAAIAWIEEEFKSSDKLPEPINTLFPTATETNIVSLQKAFAASFKESVLFVDDNYAEWDYNGVDNGWRGHLLNHFAARGEKTIFCVAKTGEYRIKEPIMEMIRSIKGWTKDVKIFNNKYANEGLYPIAYIDDCLYFTNDKDFATLNDKWGNSTLYCIRTENIIDDAKSVDCSYKETTKLFKLEGDEDTFISTRELGQVIQKHADGIVKQFVDFCKHSENKVKVIYQDEHMKSVLGIVLALQTIQHFVKLIGKDFELEFLIEEYKDYNSGTAIWSNQPSSQQRDDLLEEITHGWLEELEQSSQKPFNGTLLPIVSRSPRSLTHWRVLSIECDGKCLSIYPDGGFANGWKFDSRPKAAYRTKYYTIDNTDTRDNIPIVRTEDLKFDVSIEEV